MNITEKNGIRPGEIKPDAGNAVPEHIGVMQLASRMGEILLSNGAEIYRVKDTVERVIKSCGYENHSVYVLSNGIFITINEGSPDACTSIKHVPIGSVNLEKLARVNQISRNLCNGYISREMAYAGLDEIEKKVNYTDLGMALAYAFGSAGFDIILGGSLFDSIAAFLIGLGLYYVLKFLSIYGHVSRFPANIAGALYITIFAAAFASSDLNLTFNNMVIGGIMPLVPGYAITTSIRDLFNGDYLSGIIHLLDAFLTAACIAIGAGIGIMFIEYIGGGAVLL
ncbi:MAG: threonine/serine exporter family protein [Lachnospiraceae bacterium]|nr:threonine/serine exporter family protein [Lachnospiraceae bacterium]